MLLSILYIMWHIHLLFDVASLTVKEEMHLQEIKLFDLWLWPRVKVTQNVAQYPLHNVTDLGIKFEVATSNG